MKRLFDFTVSLLGLLVCSPVLIPLMFLVWIQDWHSPFYIALRVGKDEKLFKMVKLRSMIVDAHKTGVDSTSSNDRRITGVGRFIRRYKVDELSQLFNVFVGDMSLVGPRPNVKRETDLYTKEEKKLLSVKPGITDFSSIVFSDEGDILKDQADPDIAYNQLIRPWKSRLGIFYVENRNSVTDIKLIYLTVISILSRERALKSVSLLLEKMNSGDDLVRISQRIDILVPSPPPGATRIVTNREGRVDD
jgi:lipopolysaccharide/colanic/teichoic acid biosynthesis glycosyltransferase